MRRRPKWLLIAVVLGALFFGRPDAQGNLNSVGFPQIGPMALQSVTPSASTRARSPPRSG